MPGADHATGYRRGPLRQIFPAPTGVARRKAAERADAEYGLSAAPDWREIDWLSTLRTAQIDDRLVTFVELGTEHADTVPVVFVHGLGGCWQNWLENLPRVAQERRVIALDLPGFGRSDAPRDPISITLFAHTVDHLCAELGLGAIAAVGNSMGGFTAAELAIKHPERVERLVLVDAAGIPVVKPQKIVTLRLAKLLAGLQRGDPEQAIRTLRRPGFVQAAFGTVMRHPTRLRKDLLAEQFHGVGKPGFLDATEALLTYSFVDRLGEIACPTLVVQGTEDFLVPLGDAWEYEKRIPNATPLILEDTGHVPMLERPRTFNDALMEFLDQTGPVDQPSAEDEPTLAQAREGTV